MGCGSCLVGDGGTAVGLKTGMLLGDITGVVALPHWQVEQPSVQIPFGFTEIRFLLDSYHSLMKYKEYSTTYTFTGTRGRRTDIGTAVAGSDAPNVVAAKSCIS